MTTTTFQRSYGAVVAYGAMRCWRAGSGAGSAGAPTPMPSAHRAAIAPSGTNVRSSQRASGRLQPSAPRPAAPTEEQECRGAQVERRGARALAAQQKEERRRQEHRQEQREEQEPTLGGGRFAGHLRERAGEKAQVAPAQVRAHGEELDERQPSAA
jgi:hypothetical protein